MMSPSVAGETMQPVPDEAYAFAFRLRQRAEDSAQWLPASRLLVHVDDGGSVVPARLSWGTEDGAHCAVGFAPDMTSCYGHRRTAGGGVVEVRGELGRRAGYPQGSEGAHRLEFDAQAQDAGSWHQAGRLRVLIDDGSEAPLRWASWASQLGDACSVALRSVSPSGNADVTDLVSTVWASAEHSAAGEVAGNLVAPSGSKWFAWHERASLEFRLTQPVAVDRYGLTSANDAPDRDPAAWVLRGSAGGQAWRTLDVRSGQSFSDRHQPRVYRIAEPASCDRYRLDITATNGSPHLQLRAVRFLADGAARFTGYRQRAGAGPVPYRGVRVPQAPPGTPSHPLPEGAVVPSDARSPRPAPGRLPAPRARGSRPAEWQGWQPGGSWLPLGGTLSTESLTSPSGRFTVLHGLYGPPLAIRDNLTREYAWISDAQPSSLLSLGPDGDLAAWDHHGRRVWSTGTAWRGVRRLELRDSGELALTDAHGGVVWSTGVPGAACAPGRLPAVARGSAMRRGESLYGQSLTSDDGSTVLFHDGGALRCAVKGRASHWDRSYDRPNVLVLGDDGFLRTLALDGSEMERIAGPGAELVVARGVAELRDETGAVVWASAGPPAGVAARPAREPAMPRNATLAAWFGALIGQDRGFCVAVVKGATPLEVLGRIGLMPGSAAQGTWQELRQRRDAIGEGSVAAALAAGPDVILLSDDAALPVAGLAPATSVAAVHAPSGGNGYGTRFSLHQHGKLVSELTDQPRRRKGARVPEVAAALEESVHHLDRYETLFRASMVVPSAAGLGGELLGGVLAPRQAHAIVPGSGDALPPLVIGQRDELSPLVIRTDFTDEGAWDRVVAELQEPWAENVPEPCLISKPTYEGVPAERVLEAVRAALPEPELPGAVFIADATTMREEKLPLLAVSTEWDGKPFAQDEDAFITQFRIRPNAAIEVSCNLGIANMDFEDFAGSGVGERLSD